MSDKPANVQKSRSEIQEVLDYLENEVKSSRALTQKLQEEIADILKPSSIDQTTEEMKSIDVPARSNLSSSLYGIIDIVKETNKILRETLDDVAI